MPMPNFLVIGAMKAGTTSIYSYLQQHPQVYLSPVKEANFFAFEGQTLDFRFPNGRPSTTNLRTVTELDAYRALFDGVTDERAVGDVSHWYLYSERAPQRIRHYLPDAKLIAVLRNPVERAYSEFLFHVRDGREPIHDFRRAIDDEPARKRRNCDEGLYLDRGFYHRQLQRYLELFPREQLRIYLYEDMRRDTARLLRDLFGFLDIDPDFVPDLDITHNVSGFPKNRLLHRVMMTLQTTLGDGLRTAPLLRPLRLAYHSLYRSNLQKPPLDPETERFLIDTYRDDILELQQLLDRDLSAWLQPRAQRAAAHDPATPPREQQLGGGA